MFQIIWGLTRNTLPLEARILALPPPQLTHLLNQATMPFVDEIQSAHYRQIPKFALAVVILLWSAFTVGFGPPRLLDRDFAPTLRLNTGQLRALAEAGRAPPISADAAILYDVDDGRILFRLNENQPLPHASLTKLMTALLVLEKGNADATYFDVPVTIESSDLVGGATMGLQAAETLTVNQLLYGLLIPSGNDAAMALARHHAGSVDAFVGRMNQRAASMGLTQTRFQNPHGFDAANHFSSAQNILTLTQELLTYPLFRKIVATSSITIAGHPLQNTNQLLGTFDGAIGIKTGTTPAAGQCLVAAIERDGHTVLVIQLGSNNRYADARSLYAAYEQNYRWTGDSGRRLTVFDRVYDSTGKVWYLRAQGDAPKLLQQRWGTAPLRTFRRLTLPPADQTWQLGMTVGVLEWWLDDEVVATQPLVLE